MSKDKWSFFIGKYEFMELWHNIYYPICLNKILKWEIDYKKGFKYIQQFWRKKKVAL